MITENLINYLWVYFSQIGGMTQVRKSQLFAE